MVMPFLIPKSLLAEMISHALETDPSECCGILVGTDHAQRAIRMPNVHPEPQRRYEMDPLQLSRVEHEADDRGEKILAIYHSHTFTQAYPSKTDRDNAVRSGWTAPVYVLVSLSEKWRPVIRAYGISDDGNVTELPITTDGDAYTEVG